MGQAGQADLGKAHHRRAQRFTLRVGFFDKPPREFFAGGVELCQFGRRENGPFGHTLVDVGVTKMEWVHFFEVGFEFPAFLHGELFGKAHQIDAGGIGRKEVQHPFRVACDKAHFENLF